MNDDDRLVRLAADIADGAAIPWSAVEAEVSTDHERDLLRELQVLERLAGVHSHPSRQAAPTGAAIGLTPVAALNPGDVWGSLRIVERIGSGSFGDVYRAFDARLHREVALKIVRPSEVTESSIETLAASAVVEEGRLMARVRHPGVVTVHGAERIDGQVGVWMELVDGSTLASEVALRGPLPADEVQRIGLLLAEALAAVHRAGVLHRDIKAQNAMREAGGRTVLMDFGTGAALDEDAGALAGTPLYLAPEVLAGGQTTRRSDIYALGVLLFHLATGTFPVVGDTLRAVRRAHERRERRPVRQVRRGMPRGLARLIDRAAAADPAQRYDSAEALAGALRAAGPEARQQRVLMAAGAAVILLAAGVSIATHRSGRSSASSPGVGAGLVEEQIHPDLQNRVQIRGPAVGAWIPCHPRGTRGIAICSLADGTARPLRMPTRTNEFSPVAPARLSPDAQWLAYQWIAQEGKGPGIHLISVDGTDDRLLYRSGKSLEIVSWTEDGRAVIVREALTQPVQRLLLVPVDGTPVRDLLPLDASVRKTDLSPDGRLLLVTRDVEGQHDIAAIALTSGQELWRLDGRTDDFGALWTPDGRGVVFISDRTGCEGLTFMSVTADHLSGDPVTLKDFGRNRAQPFGFSSDGAYLVSLTHARRTAAHVVLDAGDGRPGIPRALTARCRDDSSGPSWDRTGDRLAFVSGNVGRPARVVIQSRDGSILRELRVPGSVIGSSRVRWSPREDALVVTTSGPGAEDLLVLLDVASGRSREIARFVPDGRTGIVLSEVRWDPRGDALYYRRGAELVRQPIAGGDPIVVYDGLRSGFGQFDIAGSEGTIVFGDRSETDACVLRLLPPGGTAVDLATLPDGCFGIAWIPGGRSVLTSIWEGGLQRLWRIDRTSGQREQMITSDAFWDLSVSPDGRDLLFTAGNPRPNMVLLRGIGPIR